MREANEYVENWNNSKMIDQDQQSEEDWLSIGSFFEENKMAAKRDIPRKKTPKKCQQQLNYEAKKAQKER
jgi:hypothetical protein